MKVRVWTPALSLDETKELAYWERNMLALRYAAGWYYDDVERPESDPHGRPLDGLYFGPTVTGARYHDRRRVLSLDAGKMTFHIPDDFDVGYLPQVKPNWDGHTTEEKWLRVMALRGVVPC